VAIDLPEDPAGGDRYEHAAALLASWRAEGAVVVDEEPALWALVQDYTAPDGRSLTRNGFFARVRIEDYGPGAIRPHERTHPGPKEDRLRLTRATRANLSPIFSLYSDPQLRAWRALEPATLEEPFGEVTDEDGTRNRLWRIADPAAIAAAREAMAGAELLIADGHHRYETARVYAEEVGGEGPHRYVLMSHLRGLGYARSFEEARELVETGAYDAGFFLRGIPVAQIQEIAAAGVNMPPKSTYFFPKVPTGLLFHPLAGPE